MTILDVFDRMNDELLAIDTEVRKDKIRAMWRARAILATPVQHEDGSLLKVSLTDSIGQDCPEILEAFIRGLVAMQLEEPAAQAPVQPDCTPLPIAA